MVGSNPLWVNMPILLMTNMSSITPGLDIAVRIYNVYSSHCLLSHLCCVKSPCFITDSMPSSTRFAGCHYFKRVFQLLFLLHITINQGGVRAIAHVARSPEVLRSDTSWSGLYIMPKRFTREGCSRWSPSCLGHRGAMEVNFLQPNLKTDPWKMILPLDRKLSF